MPYYYLYYSPVGLAFIIPMLICMVASIVASLRVKSNFAKFSKYSIRSGMKGSDVASRLLRSNGIYDVQVGRVGGELSDHFHPKKNIVNLSAETYDVASVASVAVAAHEIGHVIQSREGYSLYKLRSVLVPIANVGTFLAMPLVLVGLLLDYFVANTSPETGFYVAMVGVALYGTSFLFSLVTFPVELNASKRAKEMLLAEGILAEDEMPGAEKMLSAAAMTYFVSLVTSLIYFLRFLFYVLSLFGGGRRRD